MRVMRKSVDALGKVYGTKFTYGPISEIIYIASGSSVDWAYEDAGIKYSFALEVTENMPGFILGLKRTLMVQALKVLSNDR